MATKQPVRPWEEGAFRFVVLGSIQYFVLTTIAMFLYPGGTYLNPETPGYQFFYNFFSDLGLTTSHSGQSNTLSMILFIVALTVGGLSLAVFFVASVKFCRQSRGYIPSILSSVFGIISGVSFIGVAFTPADILLDWHVNFVQYAFLAFFAASIFYIPATVLNHRVSSRYAWIFVGFAILLAAYVYILFFGPSSDTESGRLVQVTSQKVIAYATIVTVMAQSYAIRKTLAREIAVPIEPALTT